MNYKKMYAVTLALSLAVSTMHAGEPTKVSNKVACKVCQFAKDNKKSIALAVALTAVAGVVAYVISQKALSDKK